MYKLQNFQLAKKNVPTQSQNVKLEIAKQYQQCQVCSQFLKHKALEYLNDSCSMICTPYCNTLEENILGKDG